MPLNLGLGEIVVILVVALLVFGGRLPQVGRSLGRGLTEFKKGLRGIQDPPGNSTPGVTPVERRLPELTSPAPTPAGVTPPGTGPEPQQAQAGQSE